MGIALPPHYLPNLQTNFSFKWTNLNLKYLGTHIPPDLSCIFEHNFPPLLAKTRTLLHKWNTGLHSWFGRCNLLKMTILPKYLYLLQALPIKIPPLYFLQVQTLFTRFVWTHKKPRLPYSQLYLQKHLGGLALPNVRTYYQAVCLGRIVDWRRHSTSKLWAQIEQAQTDIPLKSALWCYDSLPQQLKSHPLIGNMLLQSTQAVNSVSLTTKESPLMPIIGHPSFPQGLLITEYKNLRALNLESAAKFVVTGRWPSMIELTSDSGSFQIPFWSAAKIHHFLHTIPNPQNFTRQLTAYEEYCSGTGHLPQVLSKAYSLLNSPQEQPGLPGIVKRESELHRTFTSKQKENIIRFSLKASICTKMQETNFKILHRWHLMPSRLHTIFPEMSDLCWRCQKEKGTMLHIFWTLSNFWENVHRVTQGLTEREIPLDPAFFLLHASNIPAKAYKKSIIRHLLNTAKACIPLLWKQQHPPTISTWLEKIEDINKTEDLILTGQDKQETYTKTWRPWNLYKISDEGKALFSDEGKDLDHKHPNMIGRTDPMSYRHSLPPPLSPLLFLSGPLDQALFFNSFLSVCLFFVLIMCSKRKKR